MQGYFFPVVFLFLFLADNINAQAQRRHVREGNRLYQKELFDESELSYRRALELDSESMQARFNLGNSLYKQERYDESLRFFGDLLDEIDDPVQRSRVLHNMGNSLLMSQQVEQGVQAYKEALRNNPLDEETRYNLAYAMNLLDEDEAPGDGEDGQDKDDQGEQNGDRNNQEDDQDQQYGEDYSDQDQRDYQSEPASEQISQQDALRMLEAAERDEQRVQRELMRQKASEQQPVSGRNW